MLLPEGVEINSRGVSLICTVKYLPYVTCKVKSYYFKLGQSYTHIGLVLIYDTVYILKYRILDTLAF